MLRSSSFALAAALAGAAAAAPLELHDIPAGTRLLPGTRVAAEWPRGLAGDEAELLLSLDGGRTFPLRLTAEFHAGTTIGVFRVPNLPSEDVVVALRTGTEGSAETIQCVSDPVAIGQESGFAFEAIVSSGSELSTREAAAGAPTSRSGIDPAAPGMTALADPRDASEAPAAIVTLPRTPSTPASRTVPHFDTLRPSARRAAICEPKRE